VRIGRVVLVLAVEWSALFAPQLFGHQGFVIGDAAAQRAFASFSAERWHKRGTSLADTGICS